MIYALARYGRLATSPTEKTIPPTLPSDIGHNRNGREVRACSLEQRPVFN